jgi:hypothetical protein
MINNKFMQVIGPNAVKDLNKKLLVVKKDVMKEINGL